MKLIYSLVLCVCLASVYEANHLTRETFRQYHDIFTRTGPRQWTEESLNKLNDMCRDVLQTGEQPWDIEGLYNERERLELFKYDNEQNFRRHLQSVRKCCKKVTMFEKRLCFKAMREDFLDAYCDQGANHACCSNSVSQRYNCFEQRTIGRGFTQEELENDDVRPLPSGIKLRRGPVQLPENVENNEQTPDEDHGIAELLESSEDDDQCMDDFFPENNIDSITTTSINNEICTIDEETDKRKEAKACCRAGAYAGKKYVKKGGCPYLKCRRIYSIFQRKHSSCIKNKRVCGFFFVECCKRQHHKNLYTSQQTDVDGNEGQPEVELFNEMPTQNRVRKNGADGQQNLQWQED